ncbi:MAG: motility protein A [Phycisphaerales bacterium]
MAIVLGGGNPAALIDVPSILVVFGGTIGTIVISFPLARVLKLHSIVLKSIFGAPPNIAATIQDLVRYAEVARREGILSLESLIDEMRDPFIVRGVKMAVDGTDPELIRTIMETELEALMDRHADGKKILDTIGRYAPAFGMIGTLLGLIFMLSNMDDPSKIGPGMAVALITTLYGALIANLFANPVGDKLASKDAEEVLLKTIIIAGVMSIQSGDNPRVVESKLLTYLPPAIRENVAKQAA